MGDTQHPATLASNLTYAPSGALLSVEYGNGTTSELSYNASGQLKTLQHGTLGNPSQFLNLEYDYNEGRANNGQIAGIDNFNDATKSLSYTYDRMGRLKTTQTLEWRPETGGWRLGADGSAKETVSLTPPLTPPLLLGPELDSPGPEGERLACQTHRGCPTRFATGTVAFHLTSAASRGRERSERPLGWRA